MRSNTRYRHAAETTSPTTATPAFRPRRARGAGGSSRSFGSTLAGATSSSDASIGTAHHDALRPESVERVREVLPELGQAADPLDDLRQALVERCLRRPAERPDPS